MTCWSAWGETIDRRFKSPPRFLQASDWVAVHVNAGSSQGACMGQARTFSVSLSAMCRQAGGRGSVSGAR